MGFGGSTTVLAVKLGYRHRLPASYFVSVAYLCWAGRRASVSLTEKGATYSQVSTFAKNYVLPARAKSGKVRR